MNGKMDSLELKFNSPANYRICVKGFLDESWSERLSDMHIKNEVPGRLRPMAVLEGLMRDQSELLGVLNSLYEMHLPILSVELLNGIDSNRN